jgi:hypothetical protein
MPMDCAAIATRLGAMAPRAMRKPCPGSSDEVSIRHPAAVKEQLRRAGRAKPHLVLQPAERKAVRALLNGKAGDRIIAAAFAGCLGEHGEYLGVRAAGDPLFRALQHPAVAIAHCAGRDTGGIRAGAGFGQRKRHRTLLATCDGLDEALALVRRGVLGEDGGCQVRGHRHHGNRRIESARSPRWTRRSRYCRDRDRRPSAPVFIDMPPSAASSLISSTGNACVRSRSCAPGASRSSANRIIMSRISRW